MVQSQGKEVRSVRYSVMGLGMSCIAVIRGDSPTPYVRGDCVCVFFYRVF